MPSNLVLKTMNVVHRTVLGLTGGRVGNRVLGMPVVELTTTGRKSGEPRTTMLTSPYEEDSMVTLVASRGGDDFHPAWFLNLREHPEVTVRIAGGAPQKMHAEIAGPDERARLWPLITKAHANYAGYQRKTDREIPVVVLRPLDD